MRPTGISEALSSGTRLTLFSDDKPTLFLPVLKFWIELSFPLNVNQ